MRRGLQRIEALQSASGTKSVNAHQPIRQESFVGNSRQPMSAGLAYRLEDYLELVDWTGRQIREDKRGRIEDAEPPILNRLGIETAHWLHLTQHYESSFKSLVGSVYKLREVCKSMGWKKSHGLSMSKVLFG